MRRVLLLLVGLIAVACAAAASSGGATPAQARWVIRDLGMLGGTDSVASDINGRGQIVGYSDTKLKDAIGNERDHAFLWQNGRMRDLGTLGGEDSAAEAINERGQVVGWADTRMRGRNGEQVAHAFLWENGTMHASARSAGRRARLPTSTTADRSSGGRTHA